MKLAVAIPTGVLLDGALLALDRSGLVSIDREALGRRLRVDVDGVRVIVVRPADVAAYVDHGAADLGIVGKDQLWESDGRHYELADLGFGACRLVVAFPEDSPYRGPETWPPVLRIATKFPHVCATYMAGLGQAVEIVTLHGAVELAPQVGLADGVADLVATGRTMAENRLRIVAEIACSTARLIANEVALKTRTGDLQDAVAALREASR
jgi:ATP phosphoribosyltransferase